MSFPEEDIIQSLLKFIKDDSTQDKLKKEWKNTQESIKYIEEKVIEKSKETIPIEITQIEKNINFLYILRVTLSEMEKSIQQQVNEIQNDSCPHKFRRKENVGDYNKQCYWDICAHCHKSLTERKENDIII